MIDTTFKFVLKIDIFLKFSWDKYVLFPLKIDAFYFTQNDFYKPFHIQL